MIQINRNELHNLQGKNMEANNMQDILDLQQAHFIKEGAPSYELRVDRLDRMKTLIMDNR